MKSSPASLAPRLALALALLTPGAGAALAADLPSYGEPAPGVASPVYPPVFTWTGLYVGFNVGAAVADRSFNQTIDDGVGDVASATTTTSGGGVIGGGQVGYNYQVPVPVPGLAGLGGGVVIGVEADFDGTGYAGRVSVNDGVTGTTPTLASRAEHLGSARGRLGVAYDRALVYGTGGFAYGRVTLDASDGLGDVAHRGGERGGYVVGGGLEYAVGHNVSVRGEYLFYDLGRITASAPNAFGGTTVTRATNTFNTVRVGMDYKFAGLGGGNPFGAIPGIGGLLH